MNQESPWCPSATYSVWSVWFPPPSAQSMDTVKSVPPCVGPPRRPSRLRMLLGLVIRSGPRCSQSL
eukprot:10347744-Alexandrium_andersonii.AAC.1